MAVFIRYTDVVMLLVAAIAVLLTAKKARIGARSLAWWSASVVLFAGGVLLFDQFFYGGALKTGYGAGEITFAIRAIVPNLKIMPSYLVKAIPALLLGLAALVWMAVRLLRTRSATADPVSTARVRRDAVVGLVLAAGWLGLWALYSAYTWTAQAGAGGGGPSGGGGGGGIHVIRFYLPAIGLIALLGRVVAHATAQMAPRCGAPRRCRSRVRLLPEPHSSRCRGASRERRIPRCASWSNERCQSPATRLRRETPERLPLATARGPERAQAWQRQATGRLLRANGARPTGQPVMAHAPMCLKTDLVTNAVFVAAGRQEDTVAWSRRTIQRSLAQFCRRFWQYRLRLPAESAGTAIPMVVSSRCLCYSSSERFPFLTYLTSSVPCSSKVTLRGDDRKHLSFQAAPLRVLSSEQAVPGNTSVGVVPAGRTLARK